jgi:hypothetical protein
MEEENKIVNLEEGWVTGDDGRHYYIDKDGDSYSGKDAMIVNDIDNLKKEDLFVYGKDGTIDYWETQKNINTKKREIFDKYGRSDAYKETHNLINDYTTYQEFDSAKGFEKDIMNGISTPQTEALKFNKAINKKILEKEFGKEVTLYRGGLYGDNIHKNEMMSWSDSKDIAIEFAHNKMSETGDKGVVYTAKISIDDVWASHLTDSGFRYQREGEFITMHKSINFDTTDEVLEDD